MSERVFEVTWDMNQEVIIEPVEGGTLDQLILAESDFVIIYPGEEFGDERRISKFELFEVDEDGNRDRIWKWTRKRPRPHPANHIGIIPHDETGAIFLINSNWDADQENLYFQVTVKSCLGKFKSDPELKVPKRTYPLFEIIAGKRRPPEE